MRKGGGAYDCIAPCGQHPKTNERSKIFVKYRFFYGMKPDIRNLKPRDFSGKGYACDLLLQTRRGTPVTVSCNRELDIWKVQHGFSTVFFGTRADALDYCKGRFCDANGQTV